MKAFFNAFLNKESSENQQRHTSFNWSDVSGAFKREIKRILGAFIIIVMMVILIATIIHSNSPIIASQNLQTKRSQEVMNQLNDISDKVQALQSSPQNGAALSTALTSINSDINHVKQSLDSMKSDMDSQMNDIRKAVSQNPNAKQYLDPKELPFKLISIDVIAQEPYASVDYDHHIQALGVGDSLAGWQVTQTDYQTATVEFKNAKDQYIKVTSQG